MKLHLICLLAAGCFALACTNPESNKSNSSNPSIASESTAEPMAFDTLYTAFGSEPGWKILVTSDKSTTTYDIVLDYGAVKLNFTSKDSFNNSLKLSSDTTQVSVTIVDEECIDEADRSFNTSISLTYLDMEYIGCGNKR